MQDTVLCVEPEYAKHIIDIKGISVFKCPGDSLDFNPVQEKVQVGKDQEKAKSEKDSHSKNRGGKKPN